jgi:hypothetical protein
MSSIFPHHGWGRQHGHALPLAGPVPVDLELQEALGLFLEALQIKLGEKIE